MIELTNTSPLRGQISIPGDKSISHRAVMLGSISTGITEISNFLRGEDCLSTIRCFQDMGVKMLTGRGKTVVIEGVGLKGLTCPSAPLNVGNSGTTMRLLSGILAAQPFTATLTGDASIKKRPMKRIMEPLSWMGAHIESVKKNGCAPLQITGQPLTGIHYLSPIASAQVKSAILLAGLYARSKTTVTEPLLSRNHTELMLDRFGAQIVSKPVPEGFAVSVEPEPLLEGQQICVPGDISSAAYFIAAAMLVPGSEVLIKDVGINPTRDGILRVAAAMGGKIQRLNQRDEGEPVADLLVQGSSLHGVTIEGGIIPTLIDEIPIIAVMAAAAQGTTVIRDAAELKVKESNRIDSVVKNLSAMGCQIRATEDGMIIEGGKPLHGAVIETCSDHRIAMSFAIAALIADGKTTLDNEDCIAISYPGFFREMRKLQKN